MNSFWIYIFTVLGLTVLMIIIYVLQFIKKPNRRRNKQLSQYNQRKGRQKPSNIVAKHILEDDFDNLIVIEVAGGFSCEDEIIELAENVYTSFSHEQIESMVKEAMAKYKLKEEQWKELTDCDRLDIAFKTLEQHGIVARQNFTDCQSCGNSQIGSEIQKAQAAGAKIRGYTFYHSQDIEIAVLGQGLCLAFGVLQDNIKEAKKLGYEITSHLREAGLKAEWNGDVKSRIFIPMVWEKRRFTKAPTDSIEIGSKNVIE